MKKIHVKIQPLLAVAYHDAIIQWVEILSEKTFLFFFAQVLSVQKFSYRYDRSYLGKLVAQITKESFPHCKVVGSKPP